jgi:Flp pilus assembly pilin Flp
MRAALRIDRGASAVEYSMIVVAIAAVVVAVIFGLGSLTKGNVEVACNNWSTAAATASGC